MPSVATDLRYPIGAYETKPFSIPQKVEWLADLKFLPLQLENAILNLDEAQLHTPYREGGWTVHQLVHHVADSHMNAYIRFKAGLTENNPVIKPYDEKAWAETPETKLDPVISITFLKAHHVKWTALLKLIKNEDLRKEFFHPDSKKHVPLDRLIALYAWHGEHHLGHLEIIAKK